jgi:16S rRNA (guanine(966)-N(2))-methyltransferase RsmD
MAIKKNIVRIIAGELRGRQVECEVNPSLRPTPQRAREALFSILGGDLTGVHFVDVFAGTGVIGMEALSRRADRCWFIEKDPKLAQALEKHLRLFRIADRAVVSRLDAYRWAESWQPRPGEWIVFLSPPFPDLTGRTDAMLAMLAALQQALPEGSTLILQTEQCPMLDNLPKLEEWSRRKYGRNLLYFWGGPLGEGDDEDDEDEGEDGDKDGSGEVEEV